MRNHDRIIASLPAGWTIWPAHDGRIILQLRDGNNTETIEGATLSEVLAKADGYKLLPRLRRRPDRPNAAEWTPVKVGKDWNARHVSGREMGIYLKTRKECQATIERFDRLSHERQAKWDEEFTRLFPNGATEGVDYRWEDV